MNRNDEGIRMSAEEATKWLSTPTPRTMQAKAYPYRCVGSLHGIEHDEITEGPRPTCFELGCLPVEDAPTKQDSEKVERVEAEATPLAPATQLMSKHYKNNTAPAKSPSLIREPYVHWPKAVLLLSGGLDSTVMLYDLIGKYQVYALTFYYGQTHDREIGYAVQNALACRVPITRINLPGSLFAGSSLTGGSGGVVVPNRNGVMLNLAAAWAQSMGAKFVFFAANKDDQTNFPDCRWEFVHSLNSLLKVAGVDVEIVPRYIGMTKTQIVGIGRKMGVDFDKTWSCYAGGEEPCGKCDACKLRNEAMG